MRWRFLAAFLGVTVIVLLAHDIPLAAHLRRVETERLAASLERDAFIIAGTSEDALSNGLAANGEPESIADLQTSVDLYRAGTNAQVVVTDASGSAVVVSDAESRAGEDFSTRPEIATALSGTPTSGRRYSTTLGKDLAYVAVPVLSGPDIVGSVRITYPASEIDARVDDRVRGLVVVGLISLLAAGAAALAVAGAMARPLRRLERDTERFAAGDFSVRADTEEGPPEIRGLAQSFNRMTGQISSLVEVQRAFAGDASHQLRTPLTALRLQLEQGADLIDTDPQRARAQIEAATIETERLQRLVEGLLMLARSEGTTLATTTVDVAVVATERAEIWRSLAEERGIDVVLEVPPTAEATAVPGAVEQIIDNYLDNAIALSPAGASVGVRVEVTGDRIVAHVLDRGPGMSDEQLAHAFDRFWRAADAPHDGSGLGLAIVHHLATASGGEVSLSPRDGGGLDASVSLPRA
jgi:signal transduction histidine kinase